ncbi:unnamed protein product [Rhizophagus irregularis]|uniref:Uncharacterized protein n=1 Tax=Rhizophagus irregularis TaxID=588596 RepID=A0A915ZTV0_9GLOM|nr:unnamed protein product [Rhizophagus irregularis]CAB4484693.1 unnamed protein product [Rhizophagus irregularis]CAB5390066.1 unnamed protein product [Rhizophagus irregularis]CAB5390067.1 unnamed protein product [Rhizophagus irregularis]
MTSKNSNDIDQTTSNNNNNNNNNNDNNDDQEHPTLEPFTSPEIPDNPNKKLLPLAALGGFFVEIDTTDTKLGSNLFGKPSTDFC